MGRLCNDRYGVLFWKLDDLQLDRRLQIGFTFTIGVFVASRGSSDRVSSDTLMFYTICKRKKV